MPSDQLDTLLSEQRRFPPPQSFVAQANGSRALQHAAERDPGRLTGPNRAGEFQWIRPWDTAAGLETSARKVVHRRKS